jgi:NAD-dependent deacetylase
MEGQSVTEDDPALNIAPSLLEQLRAARHAMALTGAGISAESGIPTFRAPGTGLWSQYSIEDFATPRAWRRNPKLVWGWYTHRRRLALRAQPNAGHLALAQLAADYPQFTLATQNVDGLHVRAGSQDVLELHGSLFRFRCTIEGAPVDYMDPEDNDPAALERLERGEGPEVPACPRCGALIRPAVVWFEEPLPADVLAAAEAAAANCDVLFVVGTSAHVYPAAALPERARRHRALIVEVNPEETELTPSAHLSLRGPAGTILPRFADLLAQGASAKATEEAGDENA